MERSVAFSMTSLHQIQIEVEARTFQIASAHGKWPCRKGCADCCGHLAAEPRISEPEWRLMANAIEALPREIATAARQRIRETSGRERPVVCPLLDTDMNACLIYEARPIACRTYGFYAERDKILGCSQIEALSREAQDIVWGNHTSIDASARELGPALELSVWLAAEP
jgi:Fe-S-cluster containining protein